MNTVWLGYIFAVISSVFSSIYVVPKKLSKQKPVSYAMIMGLGYLIASTAGYTILMCWRTSIALMLHQLNAI